MLIILGGLPGTGKTTFARLLARELGAVHLRIDTIETALQNAGVTLRGPEGYEVAYALTADLLRAGQMVIADCVNPWPLTRTAWRETAAAAGVPGVGVEIVCSDTAVHRRRVEERQPDLPGQRLPSWADVQGRDYRPWPEAEVRVDTAVGKPEENLQTLLDALPTSS